VLNTGRTVEQFHTRTKTGSMKDFKWFSTRSVDWVKWKWC